MRTRVNIFCMYDRCNKINYRFLFQISMLQNGSNFHGGSCMYNNNNNM